MNVVLRKAAERGHANHGWLDSYHSFSFAGYYDPKFNQFNSLRVINTDWVAPGKGFGKHPHANFLIFSYIVDGKLQHNDSMGNEEILERGDVQYTCAGSGIRHSEYNGSNKKPVRFLQIWLMPQKRDLPPRYQTMRYPDALKLNNAFPIVAKYNTTDRVFEHSYAGKRPDSVASQDIITCETDAVVFASIIDEGVEVSFPSNKDNSREWYVQCTDMGSSATILTSDGENVRLEPGDGAFITGKGVRELVIRGEKDKDKKKTELIVFDLKKE